MRKRKEKKPEQIQEEVSFIQSIKNIIPDWEFRIKEIDRLYYEKKDKEIKKISWSDLVDSQGPGTNAVSASEWKRFVSLYKSHQKTPTVTTPLVGGVANSKKTDPGTQGNLFPDSFNTNGY